MNPTLSGEGGREGEGEGEGDQREGEVKFDGGFEGGNLDCVVKVGDREFDLFLRVDSNTRGHTQWFYFCVRNGTKTGKITFNICNLTKPKTLYEQGMKPYVFSKRKYQNYGKSWEQDGENIELVEKKLRYAIIEEMINPPPVYRLSFDYHFVEKDDQVFFAYSIPYTYSQLLRDIQLLPDTHVKKQTLGRSLSGLQIPILHITNHSCSSPKKTILIICRTHPGQSNSSHVLNGFISYICSSTNQASQIRNRINFIIIPMANPDGVILGNSRSSASGKDLNREYLNSRKELYPEVFFIKNLALRLQKGPGVFMFFDFHGHSRKKNTFLYGPSYSITESDYYKCRAFAKMIEKLNSSFRFYSCSFTISEQKKKTARAVLFQRYKIPYVFTVQSSIGLYYDAQKMKTIQFFKEDWQKMGTDIAMAVGMFVNAYEEYQGIIAERRKKRQKRREKLDKNNKRMKDRKFVVDEANEEDDCRKECLMFQMMQQIKQLPQKNIEPEASSDDHDDAQDLQKSKMREFNTLIIQSKQKSSQPQKPVPHPPIPQQQLLNPTLKPLQSCPDQLQFLKQYQQHRTQKIYKPNKHMISSLSTPNAQVKQLYHPNPNHNHNTNIIIPRRVSLYRNATISIRNSEVKRPVQVVVREFSGTNRKSVNYQMKKGSVVSKQFFPNDRCEIVEFPKSSIGPRKDIKKGRTIMEEYLKQKKLEKPPTSYNSHPSNIPKMEEAPVQNFERDRSIFSIKKYKMQDIFSRRTISQNRIPQKKAQNFLGRNNLIQALQNNTSMKNKYTNSNSNFNPTPTPTLPMKMTIIPLPQNNNKIKKIGLDCVVISDLQVDNLAMMIKTFNK